MLVLSRKLDEAIVIDGNIRIKVLDIRGRHVRLGIEAPGQVPVFREELCPPFRRDGSGPAAPPRARLPIEG
jgi:carbon storage regulator